MAKLTTSERKSLPNKDFAGPNRSYPIQDENHARNALSRVSQFGDSAEKSRVRAAVHRKYPDIGEKDDQNESPLKKSLRSALSRSK